MPPRTASIWKSCAHFAAKRGLEFHAISSATGEGIVELVRAMADALDRIPKPAVVAAPESTRVARRKSRAAHAAFRRRWKPKAHAAIRPEDR